MQFTHVNVIIGYLFHNDRRFVSQLFFLNFFFIDPMTIQQLGDDCCLLFYITFGVNYFEKYFFQADPALEMLSSKYWSSERSK